MKRRTLVLAAVIVMIALIGAAPAEAQVRIGFGIHVGAPPPPPRDRVEIIVAAPYPHAVWVRGYWSWNPYAGRYAWISGHWERPLPPHVYRERAWRHVPHGVAKGWWKNHGREYEEREYHN